MSKNVIATLSLCVLLLAGCGRPRQIYVERLLPEEPNAPGVSLTWLGTAGVLVSDGQTQLLIDPFVSRAQASVIDVAVRCNLVPDDAAIAEWIDRLGAQGTLAVFVSHSHYDHAMDAPLFAKRLGAKLVGSESTANIGLGLGLPASQIVVVDSAQPVTYGSFQVRMLESEHGKALFGRVPYPGQVVAPLKPPACGSDYKLGAAYSLLIEHADGTLLHHASAGWREGMFEGIKADAVLLGLAGRQNTTTYLKNVVDAVGAAHVVALHFDDFFRPFEHGVTFLLGVGFPEFVETASRHEPALRVSTLPLGVPRTMFRKELTNE